MVAGGFKIWGRHAGVRRQRRRGRGGAGPLPRSVLPARLHAGAGDPFQAQRLHPAAAQGVNAGSEMTRRCWFAFMILAALAHSWNKRPAAWLVEGR